MIKLLAVDMDGTCLDRRSRMTDATLEALRKAAGRGVIIVPTTGRNLECIPHRLAAGTLFTTGAMDEKKNRDLFRYVISSNGACVTDIRERKEIFRAPVPADDVLPLLRECGKLRLGIASHIRHRYLLEGRFLTMAGRLVYGKDARGVCCVRSMEEFIRKGGYKVEEFQFYFFLPGQSRMYVLYWKSIRICGPHIPESMWKFIRKTHRKVGRLRNWRDIWISEKKRSPASETERTTCPCSRRQV